MTFVTPIRSATARGGVLTSTLASLLALAAGCGDDTSTATGGAATETGDGDPTTTGDGDGDPTTTGDGDGDATGDGDGDDDDSPCAWQWEAVQMKVNGQTHAAYDVAVAPDGSFAAVGKIENSSDDAWIGLFTADGATVWEQVIDGGNGPDAATGVTFDQAGDVVVTGRLAGVAHQDVWVGKYSGANGAEQWSVVTASQFDGDLEPGDVAIAPDGDLVVVASLRTGDKDLDVWTRKLAAASGALVWEATYSGAPDTGGFSVDRGLVVDVGPSGSIYVGGSEGVDFETREALFLRYDAEGTEQLAIKPDADGSAHIHTVTAVAAGPDGEGYFASAKSGNLPTFWINRVSSSGVVEWELGEDDFVYAPTDGWVVEGLDLASDGSLTVGGRLTNEEVGQAIAWSEVWIANVSLDGTGQCIAAHTWDNDKIIPASTFGYGLAEGPNGAVVVGEILNGPENYLWVGGFK